MAFPYELNLAMAPAAQDFRSSLSRYQVYLGGGRGFNVGGAGCLGLGQGAVHPLPVFSRNQGLEVAELLLVLGQGRQ